MGDLVATKILGQDDWLFYGRTENGTLVYYNSEISYHWLNAPHKGQCLDFNTMKNCDGDSSETCRIDNSYMRLMVERNKEDLYWQAVPTYTEDTHEDLTWPESEDEAFMARSRQNYLCD